MNGIIKTDLQAQLYDAQKLSEKIESQLIETGGEITPELEDLLAFKDFNEKDLQASIDCVAMTTERLDLSIEYFNQQINDLTAILNSLYKSKEKLLSNLESSMASLNLEKLEGLSRTVSFKKNPPKVDISDENLINDDYKKITMIQAIDRRLIAEHLKQGKEVIGARLIQGRSLKISISKPKLKAGSNE